MLNESRSGIPGALQLKHSSPVLLNDIVESTERILGSLVGQMLILPCQGIVKLADETPIL